MLRLAAVRGVAAGAGLGALPGAIPPLCPDPG